MEELGLLGLFLSLLYHLFKHQSKKPKNSNPTKDLLPPPLRIPIPELPPVKKKTPSLANPVYIPAKKHLSAKAILKRAKSQRELFILAEIMRRPFP